MKTGLVLEGGAFRTIFSSGVCDALLDAGVPLPDYTVGVSAGITYGTSYLSRQSRRNLKVLTTYVHDRRYMGLGNYLAPGNRSYFGLKFSYETIPNELVPFDYDAFEAYPGTVEAVVTNLTTGRADYLPVPRRDPHNLLLQATCAIPLMFPVYHLNGRPCLDGGCADAIPWRRALEVGCDRVVVLLTRERSYRKEPEKLMLPLDKEMPTVEWEGYQYIGMLEVPSLELSLPVMDQWDYDRLKISPCRFAGNLYQDDLVICAHNYAHHFTPLKYVPIGTEIQFTDAEGNLFRYAVSSFDTVGSNDVEKMIKGDWDLTLFTCDTNGQTRIAIRCNRIQ